MGRIGEIRGPCSLESRGPQVTRLVVGVEVDGFGKLSECSRGGVG